MPASASRHRGVYPHLLLQHRRTDLSALRSRRTKTQNIDAVPTRLHKSRVVAAFEVEHTTSIYSGIARMLDLALGLPEHAADCYFLVAPDDRESDVREQFARPAFSRIGELDVRYLPYSALREHREAIARFGPGLKAVHAISKPLR